MSTFTVPVSMVAGAGKSSALAIGVIGLILMLAVASNRKASAPVQPVKTPF